MMEEEISRLDHLTNKHYTDENWTEDEVQEAVMALISYKFYLEN